MKSKKIRILVVIILAVNKNPQRLKKYVISFIEFSFVEGVTIIDWIKT